MKKFLLNCLFFLLILSIMTGLYLFIVAWPAHKKAEQQKLDQLSSTLIKEAKLILLEQTFRDVIYIENSQKILGLKIPRNKLLFSVDYKIRAGLDLEKKFSITYINPSTIQINLPPPEIFTVDAMDETINLYDNWQLLGTSVKLSDFLPALQLEQSKIIDMANQNAYASLVRDNAKTFFTSYASALGYQHTLFKESL